MLKACCCLAVALSISHCHSSRAAIMQVADQRCGKPRVQSSASSIWPPHASRRVQSALQARNGRLGHRSASREPVDSNPDKPRAKPRATCDTRDKERRRLCEPESKSRPRATDETELRNSVSLRAWLSPPTRAPVAGRVPAHLHVLLITSAGDALSSR
jgi:hypothetical protein